MAYHFHCGQYDREFGPRRMRNWEVPRWAPSRPRPLHQRPDPRPVADLNGRLMPNARRGTSGTFGHHLGTWDMPNIITRKVAEELSKQPPGGRFADWVRPRTQRAAHATVTPPRTKATPKKQGEGPETPKVGQKFVDNDQGIPPEADNSNPDGPEGGPREQETYVWHDVKRPVDAQGNGPYVPGALTHPDHRHETHQLLVKDATEQIHGPQEEDRDKFWRKVAENAAAETQRGSREQAAEDEPAETMRDQHPRNRIQRQDPPTKLPDVHAHTGYYYARKMHMDNLEHKPLPDTLGYRHLTKVAEHRDSDIVVKPYAIGWKGYGASGPTSCTKMRVHRPKTCDPKQSADKENAQKSRPSTSALESKKPMSRMDLAICWDYIPQDPAQEPRPPKHIDGSNGSKAPAVFTMVRTPKPEEDFFPISAHSNPIFTQNRAPDDMEPHQVPYFEKDMSKNVRKDSCEVQNCPQHNTRDLEVGRRGNLGTQSRKGSTQSVGSAGSRKSQQCDGIHGCGTPSEASYASRGKRLEAIRPERLKPIKNAWNSKAAEIDRAKTGERRNSVELDGKRNSLESYEKTPLAQGKLHQSSPDVSVASRASKEGSHNNVNNNNGRHKHCVSCSGGKTHAVEAKPKNDYKLAFKAGNPNSVQGSTNGSTESKNLKIPKMRDPYAKKSYSIPTLAPPFCIWRDASNSGYPEHWRLASVYQHAYKPVEQRRKPLIASVFQ